MPIFEKKGKGFFGRLSEKISDAILSRPSIDDDMMEEIEEILIMSDIGIDTTVKIMDKLREKIKINYIYNPEDVPKALKEIIADIVDKGAANSIEDKYPLIILVIGTNGGGKTTSIAKLGNRFKGMGKSVMFAAADTFRAAAGEQLTIWGERIGIPTIMHQEGADPSAVIFDAISSAKAKGIDVLICDTAGRLQTKKNLMNELKKMSGVIEREFPEANKETLLVLDATTGKNAISQAELFNETAQISGIILTKLDGTAKGGIAITVTDEFDMPIKFIGVGEKLDDLKEFNPNEFAEGIYDE